jgi:hypothetical protein
LLAKCYAFPKLDDSRLDNQDKSIIIKFVEQIIGEDDR